MGPVAAVNLGSRPSCSQPRASRAPLTAGGPPLLRAKAGAARGGLRLCGGRTGPACTGADPSVAQEVARGRVLLLATRNVTSQQLWAAWLSAQCCVFEGEKEGGKGKFLAMLLILVLTVLAESVL